jgi:hypothetical protein
LQSFPFGLQLLHGSACRPATLACTGPFSRMNSSNCDHVATWRILADLMHASFNAWEDTQHLYTCASSRCTSHASGPSSCGHCLRNLGQDEAEAVFMVDMSPSERSRYLLTKRKPQGSCLSTSTQQDHVGPASPDAVNHE